MAGKPLKAVVVGCRMGGGHAAAMASLKEFELAALCDLNEEAAKSVAANTGNPAIYTDYDKMLAEVKPDVVSIATPNKLHLQMALKAIAAGAKGIYCEKPMTVGLGDARKMVDECNKHGVALVVGHQRRMTSPYRTMRRLIEEKAIGDVYLIRGICAGDFLSDGTHTVDSVLYLNGNTEVDWVLGQIHRDKVDNTKVIEYNTEKFTGFRFGHAVENGAMAVVKFKNGVRAEFFTGDMRIENWNQPYPGWAYQDIEILGTKGRIWRGGDSAQPPVALWDKDGWRSVELDKVSDIDEYANVFREFASYVTNGGDHPMKGEYALRTHEVVMAVYESARLRDKVKLPLAQERFPLEVMIEDGEI